MANGGLGAKEGKAFLISKVKYFRLGTLRYVKVH